MATLELGARLDNLLVTAQEETADIDIFAPIVEREECPICLLPLPFNDEEIRFMTCCGKKICLGCIYKEVLGCMKDRRNPDENKCAFCRQQAPKNDIKALRKLMKKNNPDAFINMSYRYKEGDGVIQSNTKSLEMSICAAELGFAGAYEKIAVYYGLGIGVEVDESKAIEFWEVAVKKGSIIAHHQLAMVNGTIGKIDESVKHLKLAACAGYQVSMDGLMKAYKFKMLPKEELTQTLRVFQASSNEMKSKDRDDSRAAQRVD